MLIRKSDVQRRGVFYRGAAVGLLNERLHQAACSQPLGVEVLRWDLYEYKNYRYYIYY